MGRKGFFSIKTGVALTAATALCAFLMAGGCGGGDDNPSGDGESACVNGVFTDARDNKAYKCVAIGSQTWMAENLNYSGSGGGTGVCYEKSPDSCAKYGRLYDWAEVMGLPANCNKDSCASQVQSKHRGICPAGWYVPSDAEWGALVRHVDPDASGRFSNVAGTKLKSKTGWYAIGIYYIPGTDDYGFSALPGGSEWPSGFRDAGREGNWWSATEIGTDMAWSRGMNYNNERVGQFFSSKTIRYAARCWKDD